MSQPPRPAGGPRRP